MRAHIAPRWHARSALAALVAATLLVGPGAPSTILAQSPGRLVLGYYVPYDATSWASLEAHADQLDVVAAQWVAIDACGNVSSRDDETLKQFARQHGLKLVPSLFTLSGWLNHHVLTDEETTAHAVEQILSYTVGAGYDGFDVDLEGVDPADRQALTDFVAVLGAALHDRGKLLTMAIPPKERDVTVGWAGAYDYAALGGLADLVTIMAYEYRGPFSGPGSVAPFGWVERVTAFATAQIAPEKVLLGLAFYGYDWNTTTGEARSLGYRRAMSLAERFQAETLLDPEQRSLTFAYTASAGEPLPPEPPLTRVAHRVTVRPGAGCELEPPPPPPVPTRPPAPPAGTPQVHEVWLEESASAAARLGVADTHRVRGVATWRLGLEDPQVWPVLDEWRQADQGA